MGHDNAGHEDVTASYPDVSLSLDEDVRTKEGAKETSPAVCILPMVPCRSSPVTRLYLAKNEEGQRRA